MKYVKKPVVIEAFRLCHDLIPDWFTKATSNETARLFFIGTQLDRAEIDTLEGVMVASFGDYIIKGVKGELYPCKADIFEMSYNPVPADYKQRIVIEKEELDRKLIALNNYLSGTNDEGLLLQQKLVMTAYSDILGRRLK